MVDKYEKYKKEFNKKYSNKDKFENYVSTLPKEYLEEVDKYLKELQESHKKIADAAVEAADKSGGNYSKFQKKFEKKLKRL